MGGERGPRSAGPPLVDEVDEASLPTLAGPLRAAGPAASASLITPLPSGSVPASGTAGARGTAGAHGTAGADPDEPSGPLLGHADATSGGLSSLPATGTAGELVG